MVVIKTVKNYDASEITYEIQTENGLIIYKEWLNDLGQVTNYSLDNPEQLDEVQNCVEDYWLEISGV